MFFAYRLSRPVIQFPTIFTNSSIPPQPVYDSQPVESTPIRQFARSSYTTAMPLTTAPNIIRHSNPADNPRLPMKKRIRQRHTPSAPVDLTGSVKTCLKAEIMYILINDHVFDLIKKRIIFQQTMK